MFFSGHRERRAFIVVIVVIIFSYSYTCAFEEAGQHVAVADDVPSVADALNVSEA